VVGCSYRGAPHTRTPVRNMIGANMSFRREIFEQLDGFQDGIGRIDAVPVGCEETELCIRIHQRWPHTVLLHEPTARVRHHVPANRGTWSYFVSRCYAEGMSKRMVTRLVGADDGLASERAHVLRALPRGVVRGVVDSVAHRNWVGISRAVAIVAGLTLTTAGYLRGGLTDHLLRGSRSVGSRHYLSGSGR
jgi:hypothetical protein